ncbi:MAG TPA: Ig-like domain-containing protein [Solirubrobacter sp.]|nr:Ig-like domain-containing protein [Solirubrobacter sp.]
MLRPLLAAALGLLTTAALVAPGPALARVDDPVATIAGSPMTVYVGARGQLQARRLGDDAGIFFAPRAELGDAGFFLAFPDVPGQNAGLKTRVFGFNGSAGPSLADTYTLGSQQPVSGDGSAGNPFTQVTTYSAGASVQITQTTTYVNGAQEFQVRWDVKNTTGAALPYKALAAADFYFEGSDVGTGIFTQGPPRFVGGTNADTGRSGGFVEVAGGTTWSAYQALVWAADDPAAKRVWRDVVEHAADAAAPSFDNTVYGQPADNAGGVEWDRIAQPLAAGATATYELKVRSALPAAIQFDKTNAGAPQGVPITFTATAKDTSGEPFTGKSLRFTISGANALTGASTVDAAGNATITDPGTNAGADTIIAYLDLNNNGTREANEPQASTLATFVDNVPPSCAVKVSGDRPGGGGAGKPLVIAVNCDSPATVTAVSSFEITKAKKKGKAAAAAAKPKPKKKKAKKIVIKLPTRSAVVQPGQALSIDVAISKKIAKKYAGATVTAKVAVTAVDSAGNRASQTVTRKVKLRAYKKPKKKG